MSFVHTYPHKYENTQITKPHTHTHTHTHTQVEHALLATLADHAATLPAGTHAGVIADEAGEKERETWTQEQTNTQESTDEEAKGAEGAAGVVGGCSRNEWMLVRCRQEREARNKLVLEFLCRAAAGMSGAKWVDWEGGGWLFPVAAARQYVFDASQDSIGISSLSGGADSASRPTSEGPSGVAEGGEGGKEGGETSKESRRAEVLWRVNTLPAPSADGISLEDGGRWAQALGKEGNETGEGVLWRAQEVLSAVLAGRGNSAAQTQTGCETGIAVAPNLVPMVMGPGGEKREGKERWRGRRRRKKQEKKALLARGEGGGSEGGGNEGAEIIDDEGEAAGSGKALSTGARNDADWYLQRRRKVDRQLAEALRGVWAEVLMWSADDARLQRYRTEYRHM